MIGSSSWRVERQAPAPARPAPMASDPVSPMKICAGAAFHHRNPMHAPDHGGGDHGQVEGVGDVVDVGVAERPEADDDEGREGEDRRAGGQAVEAVGEVDGVGGADDQQHGPDAPADVAQVEPSSSKRVKQSVVLDVGPAARRATAKPTATTSRPTILARLLRPRLRSWLTLIQSSSSADEAGAGDGEHRPATPTAGECSPAVGDVRRPRSRRRPPPTMATPPMVGRAGLGGVALGHVLVDGLADLRWARSQSMRKRVPSSETTSRGAGDEQEGSLMRGLPLPRCWRAPRAATSRSSKGMTRSPRSWVVSWPLPAISTRSPGRGRRATAARWPGAGRARRRPVGVPVGTPAEDVVDDGRRVLGAGVVRGDDDHVGQPGGGLAHERPLGRSRSPPQPNTTIRPGRRRHQLAGRAARAWSRPSGVWA